MSVINITESKRIDFPKMTVSDNVFQEFKSTLNSYIKDIGKAISNNENEEHIKNIINDFLRMTFYNDKKYTINTDGYIDSAIKENGKLLAIIETKSPQNKNEMVTTDNMNKKALWETIYYFLEKTIDVSKSKAMISTQSEVRRLIITDGFNWFLIDSAAAHAVTDGIIERRFWEYKNGKLPYKNDTVAFYEELRQHFEDMNITEKLEYIYFNVEECYTKKQSTINMYKALSESFLLKNTSQNYNYEPHSLNSGFYHELLYIMGLKENTKDNKLVVEIDHTIKNSLSDQVYNLLKDKEIEDNKITELTFELVLIWVNSLLFIKLFEGQLMSFNENPENYRILSHDKIESFDDLQGLFFDVLGTKERSDTDFHNKFSNIPYLNSSLFEKQKIEIDYFFIKFLKNESIERRASSVLGKKSKATLPILEYIIDFLNNYCFSSDAENGSYSNKEIIDAAVLGLIFEKLNGYKDGANYTPSVITEYIAKEAIESAVVSAVNREMKWKCRNLEDISDKIETRDERKQINGIINSLKICDPAVGSGHFLVSVLNRIIAIKKQLGVLFKYNSEQRVKEYDITVENDVLVIRDGDGNPFVYNKKNNESREIQETLFNEKRIIIENCLFGVDINSKAVYICQLRLWIELLKNAYYKNGIMETLPNIDINIKCGSSPLSKIDFVIGKKIKTDKDTEKLVKKYKALVSEYKSVSDKSKKKELRKRLSETKEQVHGLYEQFSFFEERDSTYDHAFEWAFEFPEILDENGKFIGFDVVIGNPPYIQLQTMHEEADKLQKMSYQTYARTGDIYCLFYELAYRLLKTNGILAFITSNKWMRAGYGEALRKFLCENTNPTHLIDFAGQKVFDSATVDVNILIYNKSKNQHKTLSCIIKDSSWRNNLSDYFQQYAEENRFDNFASWVILSPVEQSIKRKIEAIGTPLKDWNVKIYRGILTGYNDAFIIDGKKKDELIAADPKSAEIIRPILRGRDISRYEYSFADLWLINTHNGIKECSIPPIDINDYPAVKAHLDIYWDKISKRYDKGDTPYNLRNCIYTDDFSKQKIVWGEISDKPKFALDEHGDYFVEATTFMMTGEQLKYLLMFLNSKLSEYFFSKLGTTTGVGTVRWKKFKMELFPIPKPEQISKKLFDELILAYKSKPINIDKVNSIIYKIYSFNDDEITLISSFDKS